MTLPTNHIICGDNVETLREFPDGCIDLTVTSPPYDNLRTYGGHAWGWEEFMQLAPELYRVTKEGGVVVWIVADATVDGSETGTSFRQALHFKECGFRLHDTMIWSKPNQQPGDGKHRYHDCFEFMFVMSKGKLLARKLLRDLPAITAGATKRTKRDRRGIDAPTKLCIPHTQADKAFRDNIWSIPHEGRGLTHSAPFPEALARDHILSWSNPGDIVLDPFAGSGTTCRKANDSGRKWIAIEVNPEYVEIIRNRMAQQVLDFR